MKFWGAVSDSYGSPSPVSFATDRLILLRLSNAFSTVDAGAWNGTIKDTKHVLLKKIAYALEDILPSSAVPTDQSTNRELLRSMARSFGLTPGYRDTEWKILYDITVYINGTV